MTVQEHINCMKKLPLDMEVMTLIDELCLAVPPAAPSVETVVREKGQLLGLDKWRPDYWSVEKVIARKRVVFI